MDGSPYEGSRLIRNRLVFVTIDTRKYEEWISRKPF